MGRFISIIDKVFLHFMAIIVIIIAYNSASFSKQILLQEKQYQEVTNKHQALVNRLATHLPGGAYIQEPIEKGFLVKEVADEITIKELFSED
jgi:CHASE3 domain sensor protein